MKVMPFHKRLDFKLIFGLLLSLLVVGLPFLFFFYSFHENQLIDGLKHTTTNLSILAVGSLETAMLKQEHSLDDEVKRLSDQSGVERIMIFNNKGDLKISSDPIMAGVAYDNTADPLCLVCHEHSPVSRKHTTIAKDVNGVEVFRNMSLIYNQPRCHACHDASESVNGILVMDLSMSDTRRQLASNNKIIFGMAVVMVLVTSIVLGLLVNRLILRRVRRFTDTTRRIGDGNLDEVIEFNEDDEIGNLATNFNQMTANLKTTLHEVERHKDYLEHVLNGIDDEIVVVDRHFQIVTANDAYLQRFAGSKSSVVGKACTMVSGDAAVPCVQNASKPCPASRTFETGTLQKDLSSFLDKNGREKYMEIYCSPLRDENGKVFQVIELRRDITERKFLEQQLIHTEKLTSIGRLSASVAHEVNNPLDGIQNCLDIIKKNPGKTEKNDEMLELISEGIRRIGFIVRRLLVFSRHHKLRMEPLDLSATVDDSLLLVKHKIEDQGIELETNLRSDLPLTLGDPYNLSHVFTNILINASDALDGVRGGRIGIETDTVSLETTHVVRVKISDNGCGISDDDLERIFSPFFTTKDTEKGTGLGLSISKKIIEDHGGKITVNSQINQGTTVSVVLPAGEVNNGR